MQTWVVKRLTENVNSHRNIVWSLENLHVHHDFFLCTCSWRNNTFLPRQF